MASKQDGSPIPPMDPEEYAKQHENWNREAKAEIEGMVADVYTRAFQTKREMVANQSKAETTWYDIEKKKNIIRNNYAMAKEKEKLAIRFETSEMMKAKDFERERSNNLYESDLSQLRLKSQQEEMDEHLRNQSILSNWDKLKREQEYQLQAELKASQIVDEEKTRDIEKESRDETERMLNHLKQQVEMEKNILESARREEEIKRKKMREEARREQELQDKMSSNAGNSRENNKVCDEATSKSVKDRVMSYFPNKFWQEKQIPISTKGTVKRPLSVRETGNNVTPMAIFTEGCRSINSHPNPEVQARLNLFNEGCKSPESTTNTTTPCLKK